MPWNAADAPAKTRKANTASKARQWAHVANGVLAKTGDDGRAIRSANAVVARHEYTADEEQAMRQQRRGR